MLCPQYQCPVTIQGQNPNVSVSTMCDLFFITDTSLIPRPHGRRKCAFFPRCGLGARLHKYFVKLMPQHWTEESTIEKGYTMFVTVMICVRTWQSAQSSSFTWGRCSVDTLVSWAWQQSWRKTPWVLTSDTQSQWKWGWAQCLQGNRKRTALKWIQSRC